MTVTSVNVDPELLAAAKHVLGVRTNRDAIDHALRDIVRRDEQLHALTILAGIAVETDATKIDYPG